MNSIATGTMPAAMMPRDASARRLGRVEAEQHRARAFRRFEQTHGGLGDDAELAFGADDQREEIVARRIEIVAADIDDLAVHQHDADAEHVVDGDAVFQAMGAAGIGGDIAAEGAGELARRVRRIEEALRRDGLVMAILVMPASTRATRLVVVDGRARLFMRERPSTIASSSGSAPPRERGAGAARHHLDACSRGRSAGSCSPPRWSRAAPRRAAGSDRR